MGIEIQGLRAAVQRTNAVWEAASREHEPWVASLLPHHVDEAGRIGMFDPMVQLQREAELAGAGVRDALAGARILNGTPHRTDVAVIHGAHTERHMYPHLEAELAARGASMRVYAADDVAFTRGGLQVRRPDGGTELVAPPEAVIARSMNEHGLEQLRRMEAAGVHVVNRADAIWNGRSKVTMAKVFEAAGVRHPLTRVVDSAAQLRAAADEVSYPVVVKIPESSDGVGVRLARTPAELDGIIADWMQPRPQRLIAQQFVEGGSHDVRVHLVRDVDGSGRVVSAMERIAPEGEFRANSPEGNVFGFKRRIDVDAIRAGRDDPSLTAEDLETARKAFDATGLDNGGVDMLGRYVGEINPTPGTTEFFVAQPRSQHALPAIAEYAVRGVPAR